MIETANSLHEIIKDYRNDEDIFITPEHIIEWANQFNENAEFILNEATHIISQVYLSKEKAKLCIKAHIEKVIKDLHYPSVNAFLTDTHFLKMQSDNKSQSSILLLLNDVLIKHYGLNYNDYVTFPKTNYIYFDDILATGGTLGGQVINWLNKI